MGVFFGSDYGGQKRGYCGIPASVGGGTLISPIGGGHFSRSLSQSCCLSLGYLEILIDKMKIRYRMAMGGRIASDLGLFFLLAKLTVKTGIYFMKKHNTILSLQAITNYARFVPPMSLRHFVYPLQKQKRKTFCIVP